jgi:hypothetical protein
MTEATFVTPEKSQTRELPGRDGSPVTWPTNQYFGTHKIAGDGPQAFHVNREPHRESRAHFHHVDQYQIFFGAPDTTFQRHLTGPLLIHYSDADTLYGPFSSGDEPFTFMTLRAKGNDFKGFMPEDKAHMAHDKAKRHYHHDLRSWLDEAIPAQGEAVVETFLETHEDQLAAFKITVPAGTKFTAPDAAGSGGQYLVVVDGDLVQDGSSLPKFTIGWAGPDDRPPVLVGGDDGARVVVLQFGSGNAQGA